MKRLQNLMRNKKADFMGLSCLSGQSRCVKAILRNKGVSHAPGGIALRNH